MQSKTTKLILASSSPRRAALLAQLGLFDVVIDPSSADETVGADLSPAEVVTELAARKGLEVAQRHSSCLILAADTVVAFQGKIYNKPRDEVEARQMLTSLSGQTHTVYTGLWLHDATSGCTRCAAEAAEVTFRTITPTELDWYIGTGEPYDKAGAYGAQEKGALFIESIRGDYTCVVGLPLGKLGSWLAELQ